MKYIWINPVVMQMYEAEGINLHKKLEQLGYQPLTGESAIIGHVKKQFVAAVKEGKGIVLDPRCPLAISTIEESCGTDSFYVPDIYPILIQTAYDLYERFVAEDESSTLEIMCPCKELSELGNDLSTKWNKPRVTFYAWNDWVKESTLYNAKPIGSTPIPLGFFEGLDIKVKSLTGEETVIEEVEKYKNCKGTQKDKRVELIEMLYCKGGCHNGNGVV